MNSKEILLKSIRKSKPELVACPKIDYTIFSEGIPLGDSFKEAIEKSGGKVLKHSNKSDIHQDVQKLFPDAKQRYSSLTESGSFNNVEPEKLWYPHELEGLDLLILKGEFGVAENGAVWLTEKEIPIRVMPFITKHLILVIEEHHLVENMHDAYTRIANKHKEFGLFISGPSKTADIEQSLVIGAQGALTLHIYLIPAGE